MPSSRPPRARATQIAARVGAGALLAFLGVVAGSCRALLIGDRIDALAEVCSVLESCYGAEYDCATLETALSDATPAARAEFLTSFTADACLGSCPGARLCLDMEPFCRNGGSCSYDHECCNWSRGEAACEQNGAQCCKPTGVACEEGDLCCDSQCRDGTCGGGPACTVVGKKCDTDIECCSHYCKAGTCALQDCVPLGGECQSNEDCCPPDEGATAGQADTATCDDTGHCTVEAPTDCLPEGEACSASSQCCPESGGTCLAVLQDDIVYTGCGTLECAPGWPCSIDLECCTGFTCDGPTLTCTPASSCVDLGEPCSAVDICCFGVCEGEVCSEPPTCGLGMPPPGWECTPSFYFECSPICDCDCGAHDPDCDQNMVGIWCGNQPAPSPLTVCNEDDHCEEP